MTDPRPLYSPMPAHLLPIWEKSAPEIQLLLTRAYDQVMAHATDETRAALRNDALSMQSQLIAFGAVQFVVRIMQDKGCAAEVALTVAVPDIVQRLHANFEQLGALHASREATKQ